jgi:3'(2'), 5'-bisphosphate nucleotidase
MLKLSTRDIDLIKTCALEASEIVMMHYEAPESNVGRKKDNSPVTKADLESSEHISASLKKLYSDVPVVSEENDEEINKKIIKESRVFWLIDPIDGTWSFIKRRGYFVINIALVIDGSPSWGLIESPLTNETFYMNEDYKCSYRDENFNQSIINYEKDYSNGHDFLVSHQNLDQRTQDFIDRYQVKTITPIASAYKFGLLVNGIGDIYPRFKRTCIWDTASGHAMLKAAGGEIFNPLGEVLVYNKDIINPDFIAVAKRDFFKQPK